MQGMAAIVSTTSTLGQSGPQPRLMRAAHEFEAQMMKELLKPMTSGAAMGEGDDSSAGSTGALGEFASEALGTALSAQGGFGIAHRIIADLSHSGTQPTKALVTGNLHIDTGMRPRE